MTSEIMENAATVYNLYRIVFNKKKITLNAPVSVLCNRMKRYLYTFLKFHLLCSVEDRKSCGFALTK